MEGSPRRVLQASDFEDGTPPRPAKAPLRGSPESQRRALLAVTSIDEESPFQHREKAPIAAQLQSIEATFEQLLNQTASNMRKDMSAREERINRRLETERKEQQTALFDLRRDLALQQSADLAAHEERLAHRLDDEKREQKAALAELRHEVSAQQELRAQLAALRRDVNNTQAALSKLASDRPLGEPRPSEGSPSTKPLEQATAAAEAAIEDLRREVNSQREQLRLQASAGESALAGLRKELVALHSSEASSLGEQLRRSASDLSRGIQEVSGSVETLGNCLRSELRREAERLGTELELERAQSEQRSGVQEARGSVLGKRLEAVEARLEDVRQGGGGSAGAGAALEARMGALEACCRDALALGCGADPAAAAGGESQELDTFRVALDRTQAVADSAQRDIARLAKELAERTSVGPDAQPSGTGGPLPLSQDQLRELSAEILKEVSRLDQQLSEELLAQIRSVEGTTQGGLASCRAALEETSRNIGHLTQDLARERSERCAALADLSCRTEDAAAAADRAERRASEEGARSSNAPSLEVGDSASVVTGAAQKAGIGVGVIGSAEHVALAACVGELDAELRMEISDRIQKVVVELRGEIGKRVGLVQAEFERFAGGSSGLSKVEARVVRLESARLDLRIGALESAWQRAASLVLTGRQVDLSELRLPGVAEASDNASVESTCSAEAMRKITQLREMLHEQAQRLSSQELGDAEAGCSAQAQQLPEQPPPVNDLAAMPSPRLPASLRGDYGGDTASQFAGSAGAYSPRRLSVHGQASRDAADVAPEALEPRLLLQEFHDRELAHGNEDDPLYQPLISDDLKERLEVLVQQVKQTLDRSQQGPDDLIAGSSQLSNADFDPMMEQVAMTRGGSVSIQTLNGMSVAGDAGGELQYGYPVETHVSRFTVGPPVLRSVSISAPRRAPSPHRSQSPLRQSGSITTTTTRIRSPSPMRRNSATAGPTTGPPPRVVTVSPVQPMTIRFGDARTSACGPTH